VTFFDTETGKAVITHQSGIKSKIRSLTSGSHAENPNLRMECKVTYSRDQDSWNKFEFTSMADFDKKLAPCLELDLLKELEKSGMLDKRHLEKRKR
jgi:hypothetical protein